MVQVINRSPSIGALLGNLVGGGLGGAAQGAATGLQQNLSNFYEQKKAGKQQEQMADVFEQLGMPREYAQLPPQLSQELIKQKAKESQTQQLLQLLGGGQSQAEDINVEKETPEGISDENIMAVSALNPQMARILQSQKESAQKRSEKLEERSFRRNEPFLKKIDEQALAQPQMDLALTQMGAALEAGDFGAWRNVAGDLTGFEFLKNASAQTVNSASKEFLISALSDLTGRPNQWIEKQISKAIINPQYKDQANEMIFTGLKHLNDLRKARTATALDLEEKYTEQGKEIPRNFQKLVQKKLEPLQKRFESEYKEQLKNLSKKQGSLSSVKEGTRLDAERAQEILRQAGGDKQKARKIAQKLGYEF